MKLRLVDVRAVRRAFISAILTALAAVAACDSPRPSAAPATPSSSPSPTVPASAAATLDLPLAGPILGPWQAEPVPVPPNLVPRVDEACRANLGPDFPGGLVITVIDARGEGRLPVYYQSAAEAIASCTDLVVDLLGVVSGERGHGVSPGSLDLLEPLELEFTEFTWEGDAPIRVSHLVGRAGAGIARVEIQSPGRPSVETSMANDWWAAWLPGPMPARWRIVALDAFGVVVDTVEGVPQVGG